MTSIVPRSGTAATLPLVRALVDALTHSARAIESATGLTNAQLFLLRQIGEAGTLSVNELASRVHARQNAVSAVLRHLVLAGLVRKVLAPDDARRAVLSLTARGRRLEQRAPHPPAELLVKALDAMSGGDARKLAAGLKALVQAMGLEVDGAPLLFERAAAPRAGRARS